MAAIAIEFNDVGILAASEDEVLAESPGYAVLDGDELFVGAEAYRNARLKPRWTNNRFWDQLNLEPLANATDRIRTHADLAFAHLQHLWANFDNQELGLLLGMAQECRIPVSGLVDAAVAAATEAPPGGQLLHLDVQLHRTVLTLLEQGTHLARGEVVIVAENGLVALQDAWASKIEDAFVRTTRFDPMHLATTEQQLYDRLPEWLEALQEQDSTVIEMQASGKTHSVPLKRDQLLGAMTDFYPQVVQQLRARTRSGAPFTLLLSHRFAGFPGLGETFGLLADCQDISLPREAAARGALRRLDEVRSEGESLSFVTSLRQAGGEAAGPARVTEHPTHVLFRGRAYVVRKTPFVLGTDSNNGGLTLSGPVAGISRRHCTISRRGAEIRLQDHSTYGTFVNDQRVQGERGLEIGDRIRLGSPGVELQMIAVVN